MRSRRTVSGRALRRPALYVVTYVLLSSSTKLAISRSPSTAASSSSGDTGCRRNRSAAGSRDQAEVVRLGLVLGAAGGRRCVYALHSPARPIGWWLPAGAVFALLIVGLANLAPVLLLPLFYSVKPLERESLRVRLLALAERAGARVLGAYEWGLAAKTKKANAALVGLGGTRRILVSDTMLAEYSDEEIEVVLAHELAHHVHGDIWKGIVFEAG